VPACRRGLVLAVATAGGCGYVPVAPGSFGSALAVVFFAPLAALGPIGYAGVVCGAFAAGVAAAGAAERIFGCCDDGRIVIDELVGQWITLLPLLAVSAPSRAQYAGLLAAGFALFRLFDIWKPGPVRLLERRISGGLGVMLDDVAAGALGAVGLATLIWALSDAGLPA
jgi:phosphatidylglycerophosphatase A